MSHQHRQRNFYSAYRSTKDQWQGMRMNAGDKEEKEHNYFKHPYPKSHNSLWFFDPLLSQSIKKTRAVESILPHASQDMMPRTRLYSKGLISERTVKGNHKSGHGFLQVTPLTNQWLFKQFNVKMWWRRKCDLHPGHWFRDENFLSGFRGLGEIIWPCTCVFEDTPLARRPCSLKLEHQAPWWPLCFSQSFSHIICSESVSWTT